MDLSRYVVLDCTSGTFFNAAHAVLIDVDDLSERLKEFMFNKGSDTDRCELADLYGIDLETWSPPDSKEARTLDAVAELLNNEQWSSDHLEAVADMVRATGRAIGDNFHSDAPSQSSPL
jgi:hypothetical protein